MVDFMTGADRRDRPARLRSCRRRRSGKGCDVDTCLFDVALHQLGYAAIWYLNEGDVSRRQPRSAHFSVAPVQTFPTADGWIFVMCMTEKFWSSLRRQRSAGRTWRPTPRFATQAARRQNRAALTAVLDGELRKRPTAQWLQTARRPAAGRAGLRAGRGARRAFPHADRHGAQRADSRPARIARARQSDQDQRQRGPSRCACADARRRQRGAARRRSPSSRMKLDGLKVVDLSWFLPGPYLTWRSPITAPR